MLISWRTIIVLTFLVVLLVGCIILQVFLSRRESPWPGLVLPVLWFAYTLFVIVAAVTGYYYVYETPLSVDIDLLVSFPLSMLQANIPAFVLLAVYFFCRSRRRRQKQLDKMQVQDL